MKFTCKNISFSYVILIPLLHYRAKSNLKKELIIKNCDNFKLDKQSINTTKHVFKGYMHKHKHTQSQKFAHSQTQKHNSHTHIYKYKQGQQFDHRRGILDTIQPWSSRFFHFWYSCNYAMKVKFDVRDKVLQFDNETWLKNLLIYLQCWKSYKSS